MTLWWARLRLVFWSAVLVSAGAAGCYWAVVYWPWQRTYRVAVDWPDAGRLEPGAPVRRRGVTIGQVAAIEEGSTGAARVWLAVGERHPLARDARISLATSAVGTDYVLVREALRFPPGPALQDGAVVAGAEPEVRDLSSAGQAVQDLEATVASARIVLAAAERLATTTGFDDRVRHALEDSATAAAAAALAARSIANASSRLERLLARHGAALATGVAASASHVATASADLAALTGDIRELVEDPEIQAAVRGVARETRAVTDTVAKGRRTWSKLRLGGRSSLLVNASDGHIESDFFLRGSYEDRIFAYAGWEGGPRGGLTLQAGRRLNGALELRTGTLRGELGAGVDADLGAGVLSLDVYRLPRPVLRATARLPLSSDLGLVLRGDDLTRESRAALVGVEKRF